MSCRRYQRFALHRRYTIRPSASRAHTPDASHSLYTINMTASTLGRNPQRLPMQERFIGEVERLSGPEVLAFISNHHVGPDLEVELFVLRDPTATTGPDCYRR